MTQIFLISDNLGRKINHNLTLSNSDEAFFDIEMNDNNGFSIKLILSHVYLVMNKVIKNEIAENEFIAYITLKLDTKGDKLIFFKEENKYMCTFKTLKTNYYLKIINNSLVLVPNIDRFNSKLYQDIKIEDSEYYPMKVNPDIQNLLTEYILRVVTDNIYDDDGESVYEFDNLINIMFVYHNCRSYAFINCTSEISPQNIVDLINKLGLNCVPNYGSDEMFITKIDTENKSYDNIDIGKKLGYVSYESVSRNDRTKKRHSASTRLKINSIPQFNMHVGPVEVFADEFFKPEHIKNYYQKLAETFEIMLKKYINDAYVIVDIEEI